MTIGFQTTDQGHKSIIAGCHPADKSLELKFWKET